MARLARVVIPRELHHVTQRGNRRQETFFCDDDYEAYIELMAEWCEREGVAVWAYCLMPNHVHLVAVPSSEEALRRGIGEAHRRYSRRINFREGWRGHLSQGRFASFPMDEAHVYVATRYVELNPVRARLASTPDAWPWSSAAAHMDGRDDGLVRVGPLLAAYGDWRGFWRPGCRRTNLRCSVGTSGRVVRWATIGSSLVWSRWWDAFCALGKAGRKARGNTSAEGVGRPRRVFR
jgi:putative transposase